MSNWFHHVEGSKYSDIHNFFAAIDTSDQGFPAPLNSESFMINLRLYEKFMGQVPDIYGASLIDTFQEGLNFRIRSLLAPEDLATVKMPVDIESTVMLA